MAYPPKLPGSGVERIHGKPKKKAKELPIEDLESIIGRLAALDGLKAKRDNALLQLGFFGGFRRREIIRLTVENIVWERQGIVITLPRSKTDQQGEGIVKAIPLGDGICCPATALRAWLDAATVNTGALFRAVNKWGVVGDKGLDLASVNTILAHCQSGDASAAGQARGEQRRQRATAARARQGVRAA
jgi:hypothetical protein